MSNKNNKKSVVKKQVRVVDEKQVPSSTTTTAKRKIALNSPKDYSSSSQIAKAYAAGCFPNFVHQKLFHALLQSFNLQKQNTLTYVKNSCLEARRVDDKDFIMINVPMLNFSAGILDSIIYGVNTL